MLTIKEGVQLQLWKGVVALLRLSQPLTQRIWAKGGLAEEIESRSTRFQINIVHVAAVWSLGALVGYWWFAK